MTSDFRLPPAGFGPGSQAPEGGDLDYMSMPQEMRTYAMRTPELEAAEAARYAPALELLAHLANACERVAGIGGAESFDLAGLDTANRRLIAETLGEGEVSIRMRGVPAVAAQESVFAGVWLLKGAGVDRIEVSEIPRMARERAFQAVRPALGEAAEKAAGVVNAPAILVELKDKGARYLPGAAVHVVNLSLLPHTEEDLAWLDAALGEGSVTILSRGYGNCRVTATAEPHVWRVQFFNSMDTLILDTFEVTGMPEVALAAREDLEDSALRIREVREVIV